MPQAIAAVVALIPGVTAATALVIGTIVFYAASIAYSLQQAQKAKRKETEAFNAAQVDRMANVVATTAPRELVLGRVRKGGPVAFRGSAGTLNETFMVHVMLAAHEIDAVEAVYLNDVEVELDADGYVLDRPYLQLKRFMGRVLSSASPLDGTVVPLEIPQGPPFAGVLVSATGYIGNTGGIGSDASVDLILGDNEVTIVGDQVGTVIITYEYTLEVPYARVWWDLGATATTADARTEELFPDLWSPAHRGRGVAKLIAEFTYDETAFPSSVPLLTARIRGAKVYDPRDPAQDPEDPETWLWSENPALEARHVYQHPYFGKATIAGDEDARFIAAANACDIEHDYVVDGVTETRPMFTAGIVGQFGAPASSLLKDLTLAMGGMWDFAGGELYIRAGVYTSPVLTLTDDDLAVTQRQGDSEGQEQMTVSVHRERAEKFNTVNLRIWDGGQDYKAAGLSPVKSSALIARDGVELAQEVSLAAVSHAAQAQHIAGILMRDARDPLTVEAPFKMTAYPLELFDIVRLTLARYGWVNKTFMVLRRTWLHDKGVIKLTLKEVSAAIYTPDAEFLPQGYADNTRLPTPWDIEPPVIGTVYSDDDELTLQSDGTVVSNMRVTWAALTDRRITSTGRIELGWKRVDASHWQKMTVDGDATEATVRGVRDGRAYVVRARSRTSVAVSDWSPHAVHVVIGKTEPPARVATPLTATVSGRRVLLEWPDNTELDFAVYEVRTADADWGEDGHVYRGRASRAFVEPPAPGDSLTWYVKSRDTGKRYSTLARSVSLTNNSLDTLSALTLTRTGRDIEMLAGISGVTVPDDLKHYEFRIEKDGAGDVWTSGTLTDTVKSQRRRAIWRAPSLGTFRISVRMVDLYNNSSAASATAAITISRPTAP